MSMEGQKSALGSMTVQGGLVTIIGAALGLLHVPTDVIGDVSPHVITIIGALISIFGRFKATKMITSLLP
jgi:hypothetical protein